MPGSIVSGMAKSAEGSTHMEPWMKDALDGIEDGICIFSAASGLVFHANSAFQLLLDLPIIADGTVHWKLWLSSRYPEAGAALGSAVAGRQEQTVVVARTTDNRKLQVQVSPLSTGSSFMMTVKPLGTAASTPSPHPSTPTPCHPASISPAAGICSVPMAVSLLQSSPQPACLLGIQFASSAPAGASLAGAVSRPQGGDPCGAAPLARDHDGGGGSSVASRIPPDCRRTSSSNISSIADYSSAAFLWSAYAVLSADSAPAPNTRGGLIPEDVRPSQQPQRECSSGGRLTTAGAATRRVAAGLWPPADLGQCQDVEQDLDLGEVLYGNEAMLELCGYSEQQLRERGLAAMLRPPGAAAATTAAAAAAAGTAAATATTAEHQGSRGSTAGAEEEGQDAVRRLAAVLSSGASSRLELPCYHSSGRRLWCSLSVSEVLPEGGAEARTAQGWRTHAGGCRSPGSRPADARACGIGSAAAAGSGGGGGDTHGATGLRTGCAAGGSCAATAIVAAAAAAGAMGGDVNNNGSSFTSSSCCNIHHHSSSGSINSASTTSTGSNNNDGRGGNSTDDNFIRGNTSVATAGSSHMGSAERQGTGGHGWEIPAQRRSQMCSNPESKPTASECTGARSAEQGSSGGGGAAGNSCFAAALQDAYPRDGEGITTTGGTGVCCAAAAEAVRRGVCRAPRPPPDQQPQVQTHQQHQQQQQQQLPLPLPFVAAPPPGHVRREAHTLRAHALSDLAYCQSPAAPSPLACGSCDAGDEQEQKQEEQQEPEEEQEQQQQQQPGEHQEQARRGSTPRRCFLIFFTDVTVHHEQRQQLEQLLELQQQQLRQRPQQVQQEPFAVRQCGNPAVHARECRPAWDEPNAGPGSVVPPLVQQFAAQKYDGVDDDDVNQPGSDNGQLCLHSRQLQTPTYDRVSVDTTTGAGLVQTSTNAAAAAAAAAVAAAAAPPIPSLPTRGSLMSLCLPLLLAPAGPAAAEAAVAPAASEAAPSGHSAGPAAPGAAFAGGAGVGVDGCLAGCCATCRLHDFALDSLKEGITLADASSPDLPIVYVNQAFLTMTGYTREEVLGRNCRFLQGPDTDPAALQAIREAIRGRRRASVQLVNYTKAGQRFWNELRLAPVLAPATGQLVAYMGIQNDVTELVARKQSEARLRDAKEAAESAAEARTQFLANMSHEIRTPLNGMIATAQLLLGSVLTPEQRELTETILESGSSLVGILGDILDFSKIDHGSLELQSRPMCLRQATEACIDLVTAEAAKKGLALAYLIEDEALAQPLLGDPVRIRQVLANLLSNAVKFTERGEVVVRVSVEREEGATTADIAGTDATTAPASAVDGTASVVHFAVSDTGIGIDEESARKLFQHFRQGSETMSRRYGGTGLGLAISKRLAQLMRGDIWVESRKGAGSTFHFTLRAEWAAAGAGSWPYSPARSIASSPSQSSGCTPRTSTEEGRDNSGSSAAAVAAAALAPDGAAAAIPVVLSASSAAARCSASSLYASSSAGGGASGSVGELHRLSNASSTGSGSVSGRASRELRSSPWLADGTARESGSGESPITAADGGGAGAPALPPAPHSGPRSSCGGASSSAGTGVPRADSAEERVALLGRRVLVDVSHAATSSQVWNSCRQLGLQAVQANACALPLLAQARSAATNAAEEPAVGASLVPQAPFPPATSPAEPAAASATPGAVPQPPQQPPFDILVVSMDRLVPALKAGWKGRPVVALGDREQLPPALQPLVVALAVPVRHHRLATALVKSTALLRWNGSSAPKLSNTPIPNESIQTLKSWRLKRGYDWEGVNRRTSLDNSALERAAMVRGAGGVAGGSGAGVMLGKVQERSPPRQQQVPIPEHAELPSIPDDATGTPVTGLSSGVTAWTPTPTPTPGAPSYWGQGPECVVHPPPPGQAKPPMPPPPPPQQPQPQPSPLAAVPPSTNAQRPAAAAAAGDSAGAAGGLQSLERLRILIAEDNKVNQKVVLKVLQQILRGCQPPDVVENGLQVLQALQKKTYDLILMDIHMPEMDGLEASKRIQETFKPEDRPRIIALSADTVQTLHDRCREAGIEAFLVKPFRIEELARAMRAGGPRVRKPLDSEACGPPAVTV